MRISTNQQFEQSVRAMLEQQSRLIRTQAQISSGQRIELPSDDPAGAGRILELRDEIAGLEQFRRNGDAAEARLGLAETALDSAIDILQRVRELALAANNGTLAAADRRGIAEEVRARIGDLVGIANTREAGGDYLFSGYRTDTTPFVRTAAGNVAYAGDQGRRELPVGSHQRVALVDSGAEVFGAIANGNGSFALAQGANMGTGVVGPGTVTDPAQWRAGADVYTLSFVTNAAGALAYQVTGANTGQVIPALPAVAPAAAPDYVPGAAIDFSGIRLVVDGTPAVGDSFVVQPSTAQDVFTTLERLAAAMGAPAVTPAAQAAFANDLSRGLSELDQALDHLVTKQADLGARRNLLDSQRQLNEDLLLRSRKLLADTADLDFAEAITRFHREQAALSAAQQAYIRVQGLSLFDYLK